MEKKDRAVWLSTKYVKDGKTYQGVSKLIVRSELGLEKAVKAFFANYGITDYKYQSFGSMRKAMYCCIS